MNNVPLRILLLSHIFTGWNEDGRSIIPTPSFSSDNTGKKGTKPHMTDVDRAITLETFGGDT